MQTSNTSTCDHESGNEGCDHESGNEGCDHESGNEGTVGIYTGIDHSTCMFMYTPDGCI